MAHQRSGFNVLTGSRLRGADNRGDGFGKTKAQEQGEGGFSTLAQSNPLCRKIVVVSEPDLKRKPVASSTLSKANKICSPSTATIGRSDMIIRSPILPVNILN